MALQPGDGGVALQVEVRQGTVGIGYLGLTLKSGGAGLALVGTGQLTHHTHRLHGHEVTRQIKLIWPGDRQVVDAKLQREVG